MTSEGRYYNAEDDTYTFRGEILRSVTVGFETFYKSETYELRRSIGVEVNGDGEWYHEYEVLKGGEEIKWWVSETPGVPSGDRDAYGLIQECEQVEEGRNDD